MRGKLYSQNRICQGESLGVRLASVTRLGDWIAARAEWIGGASRLID
jgi:hypothetical protein